MIENPAWYVVHAKHQQDRIAADALERRGFAVYLPMRQTLVRHARKAQISAQARKMAQGWKSNRAPDTPARYVAPQDELGMTRDEAAKASSEWHLERAKALGALPVPQLSAEALKTIGLAPRRAEDAA